MSVQLTCSTLPGRGEVKTATVSAQGHDTIGHHLPEIQRQLGLTDFKAMICDGDQVTPEKLVSAFLDQYGQLRGTIMVIGGTPLPAAESAVNFSSPPAPTYDQNTPPAPVNAYNQTNSVPILTADERPANEQNAIEMTTPNQRGSKSTEFQYYKLEISDIKDFSIENVVQFSCIKFYSNGTLLSGACASNPKGNSAYNEGPQNAVDNQEYLTQFSDSNISWLRKSTLIIDLGSPKHVDAYELFTGKDCPGRDPITWTLSAGNAAQGPFFEVLDSQERVTPPHQRNVGYGKRLLGGGQPGTSEHDEKVEHHSPKMDVSLPVSPDPSPPPYTGGNTIARHVSTGALAAYSKGYSHHARAWDNVCDSSCCYLIFGSIGVTVLIALWGVVLWGPMVLLQYPYWGIIVMFTAPFCFTCVFFFFQGILPEQPEYSLLLGSVWLIGGIYAVIGGWYLEEYFYFKNGDTFYDVDPHTDSPEQYTGAVDLEFVQGTFVDEDDWSSTYYITCDKDGCTTTWQCLAPIVTESAWSNPDSLGNPLYPGNLNFWAFDYDCCNENSLGQCRKWDERDLNGAPDRAWHITNADEERFELLIDVYEDYGATVSGRTFINWGYNTEIKWRADVALVFLVILPLTGPIGLAAGWAVVAFLFALLAACLACIAAILCCPCYVCGIFE